MTATFASALLSACSPVRMLNALAPDRLAAEGLAYGPASRQALDVYRPDGPGPFPVVMFIYGGEWVAGSRAMYRFVGGALAASGFVTVIPDYRLYPEIRYPAFLQDCASAFAWTRANAARWQGEGAPALIGHSAGAYNAAMLTLDPQWLGERGLDPRRDVARMVGLAGPYDFLPLESAMLQSLFSPAPSLAATQPIAYASGQAPPLLLLAGTADRTVSPDNTRRLAARIRADGGRVEERLYDGIDHREIIGAYAGALRFLCPSFRDSVRFLRA